LLRTAAPPAWLRRRIACCR